MSITTSPLGSDLRLLLTCGEVRGTTVVGSRDGAFSWEQGAADDAELGAAAG